MTHAAKASKLRLVNRIISYSGDPRSMTQTSDSGHWVKTRWQLTRHMVLLQRRTMSGADSAEIRSWLKLSRCMTVTRPRRSGRPTAFGGLGLDFSTGPRSHTSSDHDLRVCAYFASRVASDPVAGQSSWGYATAAAGLVIAMLSPVLGAIADAGGRRKPWIAVFGALLVIARR
jgi:hypothetical protein